MGVSNGSGGLRPVSAWLLRGFRLIAHRRLRAAFRAVRVLHPERPGAAAAAPLIVCLNHPSWWDPLVCLLLAERLLPSKTHRGPISTVSLQKFRFFQRLGMFPVDQESPRGAAQLLRGAAATLAAGDVFWITAQGRFTDVRERPVQLKPGLGAVLQRTERVTVLPLALEYVFWNARAPEVLCSFGEPLVVSSGEGRDAAEWTHLMEERLQATQDELAAVAMRRDSAPFATLLSGARGTAGVYGAWKRLLRGVAGDSAAAGDEL